MSSAAPTTESGSGGPRLSRLLAAEAICIGGTATDWRAAVRLAGKLSGAATTPVTIRAADDSKARITATVDSDGNRTALTLDETG